MEPVSGWLQLRSDPRVLPRVYYWVYKRAIRRIGGNRPQPRQLRVLEGLNRFAMREINA